jgi:hypothetical protein
VPRGRKSGFAPVGMTKCEADDYLEIGESDGKIRRTEFFRSLLGSAAQSYERILWFP